MVQPCCVALGQALIWGLYLDEVKGLSIGFLCPVGHAVDRGRVTAFAVSNVHYTFAWTWGYTHETVMANHYNNFEHIIL